MKNFPNKLIKLPSSQSAKDLKNIQFRDKMMSSTTRQQHDIIHFDYNLDKRPYKNISRILNYNVVQK